MPLPDGSYRAAKMAADLLQNYWKPLVDHAKVRAKQSPVIKTRLCIPMARAGNRLKIGFRLKQKGETESMTEDELVEQGVNIGSKFLLLGIISTVVMVRMAYNKWRLRKLAKLIAIEVGPHCPQQPPSSPSSPSTPSSPSSPSAPSSPSTSVISSPHHPADIHYHPVVFAPCSSPHSVPSDPHEPTTSLPITPSVPLSSPKPSQPTTPPVSS